MGVEMNFCRRCGKPLQPSGHAFICSGGHIIFANAAPAVGCVLLTRAGEVVIFERQAEPGKGFLDIPGGFCDGPETPEQALTREIREEIGLEPNDYSKPVFALSGSDTYEWKGESTLTLDLIFTARLKPGAKPQSGDDTAKVQLVPLKYLDTSKFFCPNVVRALEKLKQNA